MKWGEQRTCSLGERKRQVEGRKNGGQREGRGRNGCSEIEKHLEKAERKVGDVYVTLNIYNDIIVALN